MVDESRCHQRRWQSLRRDGVRLMDAKLVRLRWKEVRLERNLQAAASSDERGAGEFVRKLTVLIAA